MGFHPSTREAGCVACVTSHRTMITAVHPVTAIFQWYRPGSIRLLVNSTQMR